MAQSQNSNDEGTTVDEFDDNVDESDIGLDQDEEEEVDGDIESSDKLDPDQSNDDDRLGLNLDLTDTNLSQLTEEPKPVEVNFFTELVGPKAEDLNLTNENRPIDFFNLFFTRDLVTIATQTNLYSTQRHATKFKPATTQDIDKFLYRLNFKFGIHKLPCFYIRNCI
ncbi:hypothetical protein PoB_006338100 [Plakobranchus ocellatus]|uniref:PiggyBac transposable element-derived protein domain-containing protein n=1 Tax=Plakobranchus ocellatus TaxID=259542 RepID=A0AAV4CYI4_9GAST|nr:hypothetical protein PoB_006338100 [Plakobranchus ocellatus]